jgi:hypothetical protein
MPWPGPFCPFPDWLDREAAKQALASLLYESPFTDITTGPDALFPAARVEELLQLLSSIRSRAVA